MSIHRQLYIPLRPPLGGPTRNIDLRVLADGRVALAAYTSLESLVDNCGDGQPWGLVDDDGLTEIRRCSDIDIVLLDAEMPLSARMSREYGSSYLVDPVR